MSSDNAPRAPHGEILVVEDTMSDLQLLSDILTKAGYQVRPATDGEHALSSVQARTPDLILLDIKLSGLDGVEICRRLKTDPATKGIPIIFISALDETDLKIMALEAGGSDYITKPFEPSEVLARIRIHLEVHRLNRRLAAQSEKLIEEIEERKLSQEALQHSHNLMHYVIKHNRSAVAVHDRDLKYVYVSQHYLDEYQVKEKNVIGKHHYDVFPDLPQKWRDVHQKALAGEVSSAEDDPYYRDDGSVDWTRWECRPWYEADGNIGGIIIYTEIITERKQAEEALRESEARARSYVENAPCGVFIADRTGRYVDVNPAAALITGYTEAELLTMSISDLIPPENHEVVMADFQQLVETGSIFLETDFLNRDGETCHWNISAVRINEDRFLGFVDDITERKQSEEEHERIQAQLMQAQKIESIGRLAGGVAHDLNNLLSPIIGYSEMLLDDIGVNDARRERVDHILQAGFRARDLVRQLLAFSRKQTLDYRPVDMNKAVASFIKLLRSTIREDIEIEVIFSSDVLTILADISQIEQVIMNLVVNAQDAMFDGGTLTIETALVELDAEYTETHQGVEPGEYVMLAVSDTGSGMDEDTRAQIFEPFFSTKGEQGTGLGLSTTYGIVKQHSGNIWVYSEPDMGSTFKVYLPLSGAVPDKDDSDQKTTTDLRGSETILLVEDDEQVRDLAHAVLEQQGYKVLVAGSGPEALAMLNEQDTPVHLILTDVVMPGMNGKVLFTTASERYPEIKVLFMSGYTDNVIAQRGVLDEGVAFIQKPFTLQTLALKVRDVLDDG